MKVARFTKNGDLEKYEFSTINEAKLLVEKWKEEFRSVNKTEEIMKLTGKDSVYERYCEEVDDMIEQLKEQNPPSSDYLRCKTCKEEDHELYNSCRCEGRNIRIAKERRERGESPWINRDKNECSKK